VSQVAAKKKMTLDEARVKVLAHFREQGSVLRGTAEGFCEGFEVEMDFESRESQEEIAELIRMARRMCFTEAALVGKVGVTHSYRLNGQTMEAAITPTSEDDVVRPAGRSSE
jgi:uncharacterized OsmC-like protein